MEVTRKKLIELLKSNQNVLQAAGTSATATLRLADHLIANGVTVQKWIPVTERPPKRGEYLCYYKFEPESPDVICENTYFGSGIWMSEKDKVTHWMPLPKLPKEDE